MHVMISEEYTESNAMEDCSIEAVLCSSITLLVR